MSSSSGYKVGDIVCHYEMREPLKLVEKKRRNGEMLFTLQDRFNNQITVKDVADCLEYYPAKGDTVLVSAGTYTQWMQQRIPEARGTGKGRSRRSIELEQELETFPYDQEFTVRTIVDDMALIANQNTSKNVPVKCLRVLRQSQARRSVA